MSSQRRIDSSRANGAKSRGPVSPETRRKVSLNALRHGLVAKTLVLSNESTERFQSLLAAYLERFSPIDDFETDLVEQMVAAKWRQRRLWGLETALLDHEMDFQEKEIDKKYKRTDEETRVALAFKSLADNSNSLHLITRYETRLHRQYEKAFEQLMAARSAKIPIEPSPGNGHLSLSVPAPTPLADPPSDESSDAHIEPAATPAAPDHPQPQHATASDQPETAAAPRIPLLLIPIARAVGQAFSLSSQLS
jgi:hypothetical protein